MVFFIIGYYSFLLYELSLFTIQHHFWYIIFYIEKIIMSDYIF